MSVACPACGKQNQINETCDRCGCQLTALISTQFCAQKLHCQACTLLRDGDYQGALLLAKRSAMLEATEVHQSTAFIAALLAEDTVSIAKFSLNMSRFFHK